MNFDEFARQMILKYKVVIGIAILKIKPDNIQLDQYINQLKNKVYDNDMDCDSDITICSDDFQLDVNNGNNDFNDNQPVNDGDKVLNDTQETNASTNILDGFNLDNFERGNHDNEFNFVTQVLNLYKGLEDGVSNDKVNKDINNICTQTTFCESAQSQNVLGDYELIQSKLAFCQTDTRIIGSEFLNPKGTNCNRQKDFVSEHLNNHTKPSHISAPNVMPYDSQQTELYSLKGFNDYTHISQSQSLIEIQRNHLFNKHPNENNSKDNLNLCQEEIASVTRTENTNESNVKNNLSSNKSIDIASNKKMDEEKGSSYNKEVISNKGNNEFDSTKDNQNINGDSINIRNNDLSVIDSNTMNISNVTQDEFNTNAVQNTKTDDIEMVENEFEIEKSQADIIPFKVIEELNRVKTYLYTKSRNSPDRHGTDSGYKSDSQSRSSFKGSIHIQDTWMNESANCLMNFILSCPLVLTTKEITNEISWVLGRLIDRLHEDEKYPSFLEDVLRISDDLLLEIYEGDSYFEDVILRKDEQINRLYLLNRSQHIIKYTIEKITTILEKFISQINTDSVLELTNTKQVENLSYVLHILEHLLRRHTVAKESGQPISQNDERILKKSSISDIWRKKWNPNYKSDMQTSVVERKCVEVKCVEILNKIIVQAMDGYSLIAYAALQCFNLLQ